MAQNLGSSSVLHVDNSWLKLPPTQWLTDAAYNEAAMFVHNCRVVNDMAVFSRGWQCTPISYFAVLYSSIMNVDSWTSETIDFVLSQGDSIYNSVTHTHAHFDYTELPYLANCNCILSSSFYCHHSNFLHCDVTDAVSRRRVMGLLAVL